MGLFLCPFDGPFMIMIQRRAMLDLYRIILPVPDIETATKFYRALLGIPGERVSPGRHYFDCAGTILACYDAVADGDGDQGRWSFHPFQYFYFAVADLEATFERARAAGGTMESAIQVMPWGERLFYCRDPFGSPLCFVDAATKFVGANTSNEALPCR
jgi:predicted enzyme related to lactoylglutathione lyase